MKIFPFLLALFATAAHAFALVSIDEDAFAKSLGGWEKKDHAYVNYPLSGADYRTYKPETSPSPDGGIFISVRIDHMRGWLASDDHAVLEINVNPKGVITSAQSTVAIQGQSIASDVIVGTNESGKSVLAVEGAIQIGSDLVSNLTAKLLRENIVEAGRVSFPAVLRHNYNYLFQAVRLEGVAVMVAVPVPGAPVVAPPVVPDPAVVMPSPPVVPIVPVLPVAPSATTAPPVTPPPVVAPVAPTTPPGSAPLEIKPYGDIPQPPPPPTPVAPPPAVAPVAPPP